ncbi:copper chaperone PCu(A)C [Nocardiopsis kunsanensis]|uniref:Copper chaperone PCu(A)C n=1 Tax=Nocardiopsis kunsanensis TaxID=141693 RepID=A0A919CG25_9ACTN|nr:copper chaperone PCu(A)C [Nocardiopsis kunsanensis]GHD19993.1 hypothetical protein GCM10007147_11490 [Nocardiopsis kunsanensis]
MRDHTGARRTLSAVAVLALATACSTTTPEEEGGTGHAPERGHAHSGDLTVSGAWMPEPANPEVGALYFEIANGAEADRTLTGVVTSLSETAELHTTGTGDNGASHMEEVEEIPVPAGETVELTSGGHHVMVLDLPEPPAEGEEFTAVLTFAGGTELDLTVPVEAMAGNNGDH